MNNNILNISSPEAWVSFFVVGAVHVMGLTVCGFHFSGACSFHVSKLNMFLIITIKEGINWLSTQRSTWNSLRSLDLRTLRYNRLQGGRRLSLSGRSRTISVTLIR